MGNKTEKKLDRFLVECPMCGNVPPKLIQDFTGFYYFECDNKSCKVGKVKIYTKKLTERLEKKKKRKDIFGKKRTIPKILQETIKGTKAENIDWTLVGMIVLLILFVIYLQFLS
jgi:hypothetical protein